MRKESDLFFSQFFKGDEQHKHVEAELRIRLSTLEMEAAQHQAVVDGAEVHGDHRETAE